MLFFIAYWPISPYSDELVSAMDFFILPYAKGLAVGFMVAAPIGPVGVLCIQRSLVWGRLSGFVSGLGAACADALYCMVSIFGLSLVSSYLLEHQMALRLFGGLFLIFLAVRTYWSPVVAKQSTVGAVNLFQAFASVFALTITNPATILAFAAIFSGFRLIQPETQPAPAFALIVGVFMGSTLWWFTLSLLASFMRTRLSMGLLGKLNKLAGAVIGVFGAVVLISLV